MKALLELQKLDLKIERLRELEGDIPKQKNKYDIHRKRLAEELKQREQRYKGLQVEQRDCEGEIAQKQGDIRKKEGQLMNVKKNEEYTALLHEIELLKKQIDQKEERIIGLMEEIEGAREHFDEDKKRIEQELKSIEAECIKIDAELKEAVEERKATESKRAPLIGGIDHGLLKKYERIRKSLKSGAAVVPLAGESCSGCFMQARPQEVNMILAGSEFHSCSHCGRLLYWAPNFSTASAQIAD
ncbi:MAG: hypothetical protein HYV27_05525 [Candidatus Hydrogenedentes bacterium]|nr:hypothetical protein [Candidatus Hydrogenedentota bacterium]